MKLRIVFCLFVLWLFAPFNAFAQETSAPDEANWAQRFDASLNRQHGRIFLLDGHAILDVPDSFYYLDAADAERVLTEAWGNPYGDSARDAFS